MKLRKSKRFNLRLDEDTHRLLSVRSERTGLTKTKIVERALRSVFGRQARKEEAA